MRAGQVAAVGHVQPELAEMVRPQVLGPAGVGARRVVGQALEEPDRMVVTVGRGPVCQAAQEGVAGAVGD